MAYDGFDQRVQVKLTVRIATAVPVTDAVATEFTEQVLAELHAIEEAIAEALASVSSAAFTVELEQAP